MIENHGFYPVLFRTGESKNSRSIEREFFYPSRQAWYIITQYACISSTRQRRVVSHHTVGVYIKFCRLDEVISKEI